MLAKLKVGQDGRTFFRDVDGVPLEEEDFHGMPNWCLWDAGRLVKHDHDMEGAIFARGVFVACMLLRGVQVEFTGP